MKTLLDTNPLTGACTMCGRYSIQLRGHVCRECRPQDEPTMYRFDPKCHTCGTKLQSVLDGEEWCPTCGQYRRYRSHGWSMNDDHSPCTDCRAPIQEAKPE